MVMAAGGTLRVSTCGERMLVVDFGGSTRVGHVPAPDWVQTVRSGRRMSVGADT